MSPRSLTDRLTRGAPAFAATLIGGALALVVGLPLKSPDDLLANTASVAIMSNAGALALAIVWAYSPGSGVRRTRFFTTACLGLYLLTVLAAVLAESVGELNNTVSYVVPIASVVFVSTAIFTPIIDRFVDKTVSIYMGLSLSIATLAAGIIMALYEVGFTEAPSLSLPPPP